MPSLSDTKVRGAKPRERPYKLFDERGLYLLVTPTGGRLWRLKYRVHRREKLISLGTYPDVPLKRAREKRDEARRLIADDIDPSAERQAKRAALLETFEGVAKERSEEHTSELQSPCNLVCRLLLEKKKFQESVSVNNAPDLQLD